MTRVARLFWRALLLRCPNCGGRPIFRSWFTLVSACPGCGLALERQEEGYFLGAMAINLIVGETIPIVAIVLTWLLTWPSSPYLLMEIGGIGGGLLLPLLFFPFSRTVWLAFDLTFRPIESKEIVPLYGGEEPERKP